MIDVDPAACLDLDNESSIDVVRVRIGGLFGATVEPEKHWNPNLLVPALTKFDRKAESPETRSYSREYLVAVVFVLAGVDARSFLEHADHVAHEV